MSTRALTVLSLSLSLAGCGRGDAAAPSTPAPPEPAAIPPEAFAAQAVTPTRPRVEPPSIDLLRTAADDGSFEVFAAAIEIAGLTEAIQGLGPYTMFAPTDDAFAALPLGTTEALLADPDLLLLVIAYHVVPGALTAGDLGDMTSATTVLGADLAIDDSTGALKINDATVVRTDLMASNGVIHAIDTLLIPQAPPGEPEPQ